MRYSIGVKLSAGFLILALLTGLIVVGAVDTLSHLESTSGELAELHIPEVHLLWNLRILLLEMGASARHGILEPAGEEGARALEETAARIRRALMDYRGIHPHPSRQEQQLLGSLEMQCRSLEVATQKLARLVESGRTDAAHTLLTGRWKILRQEMLLGVSKLLEFEDREIVDRAGRVRAQAASSRRRLLALAGAATLLAACVAVGFTLSLTRPLARLLEVTERVAHGELGSRARVERADEVGFLAARFNAMLDRVNGLLEEQRRFYADISHELRAPLTVMRGEAEVALRGAEKTAAEYRESLQHIVEAAAQMGRFVDELLFLARADSGQIRYLMEPLDLKELLETVLQQVEGLCALRSIRLERDIGPAVTVKGDGERLRQVFFILLDNAIKYTPPGGRITLGLASEPAQARAWVSDTGSGIPPEDRPHIFERFYRVRRSEGNGGGGGTGLGLSIAHSIVRSHGGEISVESVPDRGSTFTVLLPRQTVAAVEDEACASC